MSDVRCSYFLWQKCSLICFPSCFLFHNLDLAVCFFLQGFFPTVKAEETYGCEGGAVLVSLVHY